MDILALELRREQDVVLARKRARQVAEALGFDPQSRVRIATSVSELVRNAHRYAGGGRILFRVDEDRDPRMLRIRVSDEGPGIPHLDAVLGGRYQSRTGLGQGLLGTRRLSDEFHIDAPPGRGTVVELGKRLPRGARPFGERELAEFAASLARERADDAFAEVQQQNQELLHALAELRERQDEIERLNRALEDRSADLATQAAVADEARAVANAASAAKSEFLAMMSHELRTPLGAIIGYARLMEMGIAGPVTEEQAGYLQRIGKAQAHLLGLIDDILAFAKLDSGKLPLELAPVQVSAVCETLQALTEPQVRAKGLRYICESIAADLRVLADADKVLQILVNLLTNAIKFTPAGGSIALAARADESVVRITLSDSGRGIPEDKLEAIFEPFVQIERRLRGTSEGVGLGLAISRELARAMGGDLRVRSSLGAGASFTLTLPRA